MTTTVFRAEIGDDRGATRQIPSFFAEPGSRGRRGPRGALSLFRYVAITRIREAVMRRVHHSLNPSWAEFVHLRLSCIASG